ncbi:MAG TPA: 16S rRNA (cytosine(967)-C(5))-methyltransferase RsmB [Gammaproteobacteria bacterium]|nr:16S rRNA (cytosine(967)-C(5))-methyltransferase RsmB [Gammaproteobacteria bacterium]
MKFSNPRWVALQMLLQVTGRGRSLDDIVNGGWFRSLAASPRDLGLARELSFGYCRWYFALAKLLEGRLQKPLRNRDRDIEIILLLGLYQLLVMKTEAHAAVNESVQLAVGQKKAWARGLINAVLRGVIRDGVELDQQTGHEAYPEWMRKIMERDWGERAEALMRHGNQRPPLTLRVDTRQIEVDEMIAMLDAEGVEAQTHARVESAIELPTPCDVTALPGFSQGLLSVQDASAQLAATLLPCRPGLRVLDACAAPGGKAMHLLQACDELDLDAVDNSEPRLERLRQNLARIGKTARILIGDAGNPRDWFDGVAYDLILADVPCSASGVLRRHPDIKLLRRENDIMPLLALQRKIVDALWQLLKPGGSMLYCTCSVFKEENECQIEEFVGRHADCVASGLEQADWGELRPRGRQILTGSDNMDGFYYALLTRGGGK